MKLKINIYILLANESINSVEPQYLGLCFSSELFVQQNFVDFLSVRHLMKLNVTFFSHQSLQMDLFI